MNFSNIYLALKKKNREIRIINQDCLLNKIIYPNNISNSEKEIIGKKFSVILMNRLLFIKFLEEKNLVPNDFLSKLWEKKKNSSIPGTFYGNYLKPLFYEIFNIPTQQRKTTEDFYKGIPYLNGGLFRENVPNEKNFDIYDDIMEELINFLEKYKFTFKNNINNGEDTLDPNILGNIYEKTINLLTKGQKRN